MPVVPLPSASILAQATFPLSLHCCSSSFLGDQLLGCFPCWWLSVMGSWLLWCQCTGVCFTASAGVHSQWGGLWSGMDPELLTPGRHLSMEPISYIFLINLVNPLTFFLLLLPVAVPFSTDLHQVLLPSWHSMHLLCLMQSPFWLYRGKNQGPKQLNLFI